MYSNVPPLHRHSSDHGGHAVTTQTVSKHRGHHGVAVGDVGPMLLRQGYDDLKQKGNGDHQIVISIIWFKFLLKQRKVMSV